MAPTEMIIENARAKLNLALHVRARRADGYHELETLFAFVEFGDEVRVSESEEEALFLSGPFGSRLTLSESNLVSHAHRQFARTFGETGPIRIELVKNIPIAAGLGGGSADAAAVLRALARRAGVSSDDSRLFEVADRIGSDVPACLLGRTAIGRGRGEQLEPIDGAAGMPVLLVNPGVEVSTREVFARWGGIDLGPMPEGSLEAIICDGRNDLEPPARAIAPVIDDVLALLAAQEGVVLARMSGSGATCFALFDSIAARDRAAGAMNPEWWAAATLLV